MAHDAHALGLVDEIRFETNQTARGDDRLDADLVADVIHVHDLALARGEILHDGAHEFFRNFEEQLLDGFEEIAFLVLAVNDLGTRNEHFVTFAAHLLDQNRDLHFATAADEEYVRNGGVFDAQGDVRADFLGKTFLDVTRGDELAVLAG